MLLGQERTLGHGGCSELAAGTFLVLLGRFFWAPRELQCGEGQNECVPMVSIQLGTGLTCFALWGVHWSTVRKMS